MVRVLLAVRHDRLRAALHEVLLLPGEFICGEASNMDELCAHLLRQDWNVLLLDMSFPEQTKLQTVRTLRHSYPRLPILPISILSGIAQKHWEEAGASGFLSKAKLAAELVEAVRVLSRGGKYFADPDGAEMLP